MSTDWDVWCRDCNEAVTDFCDANHREPEMWEIIAAQPQLAALGAVAPGPYISWDGSDTLTFRPGPFAKHVDHKLEPRNEYGAWASQCPEYVKCACGSHRRCTLPVKHDGAHASVDS